jgi:hypothetical protein
MQQKLEQIAKCMSHVTYSISGGLVVSEWLSFVDSHAAAFGVIIGIMTFITNFIFQILNHKAIRAKNG